MISGQPCKDDNVGQCSQQMSQASMLGFDACSLDMIANMCRKTCGKCSEPSTGTSTTEGTTNGEETPITVAGTFYFTK